MFSVRTSGIVITTQRKGGRAGSTVKRGGRRTPEPGPVVGGEKSKKNRCVGVSDSMLHDLLIIRWYLVPLLPSFASA